MNKIIKMAFVVAFIAIAGYGVYANQKTIFVELSILQMVLERDIKCFINNDFSDCLIGD